MPISPTIRPVTPQDLEALADMVRHLARFHGDAPTVTLASLARDCLGQAPWLHVLVAEQAGALCGYAMLCPRAQAQFGVRGMDLHHLYVQKDLRGQGVGRALVDAARAHARAVGALFLDVSASFKNDIAGQAYLSMGFHEVTAETRQYTLNLG